MLPSYLVLLQEDIGVHELQEVPLWRSLLIESCFDKGPFGTFIPAWKRSLLVVALSATQHWQRPHPQLHCQLLEFPTTQTVIVEFKALLLFPLNTWKA